MNNILEVRVHGDPSDLEKTMDELDDLRKELYKKRCEDNEQRKANASSQKAAREIFGRCY